MQGAASDIVGLSYAETSTAIEERLTPNTAPMGLDTIVPVHLYTKE
jgi:hypothetical protein